VLPGLSGRGGADVRWAVLRRLRQAPGAGGGDPPVHRVLLRLASP